MISEFYTWYNKVPGITRCLVTSIVLLTVVCHLGAFSPRSFHLDWDGIIRRFEAWRLVTNFLFFGPPSTNWLLAVFIVVQTSQSLEERTFERCLASYLFLLIYGACTLLFVATMWQFVIRPLPFLSSAMSSMLLYVWAYSNPGVSVNLMGVYAIQAPYLPWALVAFSLFAGSSVELQLMGIAVGHSFYFLEVVFPQVRGYKPLKPLRNLVDVISQHFY